MKELKLSFDSSPVGMLLLDKNCTVRAINKHLETDCGIDLLEHIGNQVIHFLSTTITPASRSLECAMNLKTGSNNVRTTGLCIRKADGLWVPIDIISPPLRSNKDGFILLIIMETANCTANDVRLELTKSFNDNNASPSCSIELTNDLQSLARRFDRVIANQIHSLPRANHPTSDQETDFRMSLKADAIAKLSHELRSPLSGIIGMCDFLLNSNLAPEQAQATQLIQETVQSLLKITSDTLDYGRIAAKRVILEPSEFDPVKLTESVCKLFTDQAGEKGISLICHIEPNVPRLLLGDGDKIRQILINLLHNAVKFSDNGEIVVKTSIEAMNGHLIDVKFTVTDNGFGISREEMKRLFEPFVQASDSIRRKYGGSGLGLAISHSLTKLMNGTLSTISEEGKGSTFSLSIPLSTRSGIGGDMTSFRAAGSILLLSNSNSAQHCYGSYLKSIGLTVVSKTASTCRQETANSGSDDIEFDLIAIDVDSITENFSDLILQIEADNSLRGLPILLIGSRISLERIPRLAMPLPERRICTPLCQSALIESVAVSLAAKRSAESSESTTREQPIGIEPEVLVIGVCELSKRVLETGFKDLSITTEFREWFELEESDLSSTPYRLAIIDLDCQNQEVSSMQDNWISIQSQLSPLLPRVFLLGQDYRNLADKIPSTSVVSKLIKPIDKTALLNTALRIVRRGEQPIPGKTAEAC